MANPPRSLDLEEQSEEEEDNNNDEDNVVSDSADLVVTQDDPSSDKENEQPSDGCKDGLGGDGSDVGLPVRYCKPTPIASVEDMFSDEWFDR